MNVFHKSVLLKEVIDYLDVKKGKKYIDSTLGGGGHTLEVLERGGIVLGVDQDQEAIDHIEKNFKFQISNFKLTIVRGNFRDIDKIAHLKGFDKVSGIIFDLGLSSHQIETSARGFSFLTEAPLDMRMDKSLEVRARDLINALTEKELYELFTKLGEEYNARAISSAISRARRIKPIETTTELANIIKSVGRHEKIHPATKVFQALRIAINDELNNLRESLPRAVGLLDKGGVLAIISFHSLEDRIVKNTFLEFSKEGIGTILTKRPVEPNFEEIKENKRSRSAKLRIFRKN
ncbi:MAG: 16S rRNA (cytosine(1402)-N(4))-methyltransferase RsmH [bacterium]|nr:16S rRNA (cytosine(1402)-N(4))-methyltransferase RsmH [bacterium]